MPLYGIACLPGEIVVTREYASTLRSVSIESDRGESISSAGAYSSPEDLASIVQALVAVSGYAYLVDVPEQFAHLDFLKLFGEFMPQYDGSLVWDLKPEPDMDDVYHSRNTRALVPHTEGYEFVDQPPHYLALWSIQPTRGPGGETTLADGHRFLETFTAAELNLMRTRICEWHSSEGLARKGVHLSSHHRILTTYEDDLIFRFSYNNMTAAGDPFLENFLERGRDFFDGECLAINIERNGLLIWDNWRMMHSRNAFNDPGRHLKRILVA
jgi:alpha-ketoglutarate-dependent taurine dioxygenase